MCFSFLECFCFWFGFLYPAACLPSCMFYFNSSNEATPLKPPVHVSVFESSSLLFHTTVVTAVSKGCCHSHAMHTNLKLASSWSCPSVNRCKGVYKTIKPIKKIQSPHKGDCTYLYFYYINTLQFWPLYSNTFNNYITVGLILMFSK